MSIVFILDNQFGATTVSGRVRIYAFTGHFLSTSISWDCVVGGGSDYMKYRGTISEEKITGTFEYSVNGFGGGGDFRLQAKDPRRLCKVWRRRTCPGHLASRRLQKARKQLWKISVDGLARSHNLSDTRFMCPRWKCHLRHWSAGKFCRGLHCPCRDPGKETANSTGPL